MFIPFSVPLPPPVQYSMSASIGNTAKEIKAHLNI